MRLQAERPRESNIFLVPAEGSLIKTVSHIIAQRGIEIKRTSIYLLLILETLNRMFSQEFFISN